jgi:hypothetical protein
MIKLILSNLKHIIPEEELQAKVLWRSIGVIAWVSFMFAGVASMVFFATFDPIDLGALATFSIDWSAQAMYTTGFLLFWLFGFCSTLASVILLALPLAKRQRSLPD